MVNLLEEIGTTAEAEVREGAMVKTPNPRTKTVRIFGAAVRTVGKEIGLSRKNIGLGGGEKIFVRPCHQGAHSEASHRRSQYIHEACHGGAHSKAVPSQRSQ